MSSREFNQRALGLGSALLLLFGAGTAEAQTSATSAIVQPPVQAGALGGRSRLGVASRLGQVYRILVQTEGKTKSATSFLVSGKRIVATNHHVVEGGRAFLAGYVEESGGLKRIPLRLLASFPQKDLALLEAISDLPGDAIPVASEDPDPASDLYAIGFPSAADLRSAMPLTLQQDPDFFRPSVVRGAVSRIITGSWEQTRLQHQTPISAGYSGGPLLNEAGVAVGISTSISKDASGVSYGALGSDLLRLLGACGLQARGLAERSNAVAGQRSASLSDATSLADIPAALPEHETLRRRGYRLLREGNVAAARAIFRLLAKRYELAEGYVGLAATYDPNFLTSMNVIGISGDFAKAGKFYDKARSLGGSRLSGETAVSAGGQGQRCERSLCFLVSGSAQPQLACQSEK